MSALSALLIIALPLAFMLHDAEELVLQHRWLLRNSERIVGRFPKAKRIVNQLLSVNNIGFGIAVAEEFIIITLVTLLCLSISGTWMMWIWIAIFGAFSLHLLVHLAMAIALRSYVPGVATSLLLLPYAGYTLFTIQLAYPIGGVILATLAGCAFAAANLMLALRLGQMVNNIFNKNNKSNNNG